VRLAFWAILIEAFVGISAGIVSAVRKYTFFDAFATVSTTMVLAVPVFVLGFVLQWVFGITSRNNGWPSFLQLQVTGSPARWNAFFFPAGDGWRYLVLPAITLACVNTAVVARMARTTMIEVQETDYMRTARAKGLPERVITMKHGLRNALIPVVTLLGMDIGNLMGTAVITETVFSWPGMGKEIARRAESKDAPVVLGLTLVLIIVYVVANLLVDLSYGFLDPRIRYGKEAR
jgi:ABC-type dipeptide/oligopeptide/nickel transport system permease component